MSRGASRTRPVTASQVKQFAGKAEEYLAASTIPRLLYLRTRKM